MSDTDINHATIMIKVARIEDKIDLHHDLIVEIKEQVDILTAEQKKQAGFVAGVLFLASIVVTALTLFKQWFIKTFLGV